MPHFQHVEKADLAVSSLDLEGLANYITSLEQYYGEPESGALVLTLDSDENQRDEKKALRNAFKVLQARNGQRYPNDALVIKTKGPKLMVSIEPTPPAKTPRPRRPKAAAA